MPEDIADRDVLVVDPMLATGGSLVAAIEYLRNQGVKNLKLMVLVAAPEGVRGCSMPIPTWCFTPAPWTSASTTPPISFPVSAMQATAFSAPSSSGLIE